MGSEMCIRDRLSSVLKFSMYTLVYFLIRSSNTPRSSLYSSRFTFSYGVSSTLICFATRAHLCIFLVLPTTGTVISSFWHIQPGPPHEIAASAISRSPLGRGGDRPRSALHASLEPSVLMQSSILTAPGCQMRSPRARKLKNEVTNRRGRSSRLLRNIF